MMVRCGEEGWKDGGVEDEEGAGYDRGQNCRREEEVLVDELRVVNNAWREERRKKRL